eukprot:1975261-Pyramimonas_sp.AAC.1
MHAGSGVVRKMRRVRSRDLEVAEGDFERAGWHMMTRSAIPRWQIPNFKALCNNKLIVQVVAESLETMSSGDSAVRKKDIERRARAGAKLRRWQRLLGLSRGRRCLLVRG